METKGRKELEVGCVQWSSTVMLMLHERGEVLKTKNFIHDCCSLINSYRSSWIPGFPGSSWTTW